MSSVLNASVRLSRGTITSPREVRRVVGRGGGGEILANFSSNALNPIPPLETVQSHFQTEGEN